MGVERDSGKPVAIEAVELDQTFDSFTAVDQGQLFRRPWRDIWLSGTQWRGQDDHHSYVDGSAHADLRQATVLV